MIEIKQIKAVYFSPTGHTARAAQAVATELAARLTLGQAALEQDITLPAARQEPIRLQPGDAVVFALPVYAGRAPNVLLAYLRLLEGNGAIALPLSVYGNRHFDDALLELADLLSERGCTIAAAAAFIGEHAFSDTLAQGRPDSVDLDIARRFADQAADKLLSPGPLKGAAIAGQRPYRPYYMPKDAAGQPADIRRVKPRTSAACLSCGLCARLCPMGSIDADDPSQISGICIKCGACIKKCPTRAKSFTDQAFIRHKEELERGCAERREPQLFY